MSVAAAENGGRCSCPDSALAVGGDLIPPPFSCRATWFVPRKTSCVGVGIDCLAFIFINETETDLERDGPGRDSMFSFIRMKTERIPEARAKLAASLPSPTEILRGSLLHRRRQLCPGPGHPAWVLTVSHPGGRTKTISLSAEQKVLLQQWLRNYRKRKDTLERICVLNRQLLRPENPA